LIERRKRICFEGLRRMDYKKQSSFRSSTMDNFDKSQANADKVYIPFHKQKG
jgi:hypothetical protein